MKIFNLFLLQVSLLFASYTATAQQDSSGVYITADDFVQGKLSYAINCTTEKHKIKLNDFFGKSYITVKHKDSSYKLFKAEIFGYKTCNEAIVRFQNGKELVLLNPSESILIYRQEVVHPAKGRTNVTNYYFSKDAASPVLSLTTLNLKKVFPDNHSFHMKLDELFKYNTDLAAYDDFHKMYKLNWVYGMSSQK